VADEISLVHTRTFAVGVDVGQAHDPTAICIASRVATKALNPMLALLNPYKAPRYEVQHLERLSLGKGYPQQFDRMEHLNVAPAVVQPAAALLIDYTDVGRPVFDMFAQRGALRCVQGVIITWGCETTHARAGWAVRCRTFGCFTEADNATLTRARVHMMTFVLALALALGASADHAAGRGFDRQMTVCLDLGDPHV
jgi:hypothetical protein